MITNLQELILALNEAWLSRPLATRELTQVRVHGEYGLYVIDQVWVRPDDGSLILWLDERGDPDER